MLAVLIAWPAMALCCTGVILSQFVLVHIVVLEEHDLAALAPTNLLSAAKNAAFSDFANLAW